MRPLLVFLSLMAVSSVAAQQPGAPSVVNRGSADVSVEAARQGDQVLEAVGPPNTISGGEASVVIG